MFTATWSPAGGRHTALVTDADMESVWIKFAFAEELPVPVRNVEPLNMSVEEFAFDEMLVLPTELIRPMVSSVALSPFELNSDLAEQELRAMFVAGQSILLRLILSSKSQTDE